MHHPFDSPVNLASYDSPVHQNDFNYKNNNPGQWITRSHHATATSPALGLVRNPDAQPPDQEKTIHTAKAGVVLQVGSVREAQEPSKQVKPRVDHHHPTLIAYGPCSRASRARQTPKDEQTFTASLSEEEGRTWKDPAASTTAASR